jgi:hypothetical protein
MSSSALKHKISRQPNCNRREMKNLLTGPKSGNEQETETVTSLSASFEAFPLKFSRRCDHSDEAVSNTQIVNQQEPQASHFERTLV